MLPAWLALAVNLSTTRPCPSFDPSLKLEERDVIMEMDCYNRMVEYQDSQGNLKRLKGEHPNNKVQAPVTFSRPFVPRENSKIDLKMGVRGIGS